MKKLRLSDQTSSAIGRQRCRSLVLLVAAALLPAVTRAEIGDVAQATTGRTPLALVRVDLEVGVQTAAGDFTAIELPVATALSRIEPLAGGWIAVGNRWRGQEVDLFLLESRGDLRRELPTPAGFSGPPRRSPRLVVTADGLQGLVWLEGLHQHELTVWAARWQGEDWGPPELVSPRGPQAQLAPSVAVLDDGSWLLVWAAVIGEDDEILWSRRSSLGWSPPAQLNPDNAVPDITPVVTAIRGGAMAAWSFLDDRHFRLVSARFDGKSWTLSPPFGRDGSHRPLFLDRQGRPALVYRTSAPAGWAVIDHDADGRTMRHSFLARSSDEQPIVDVRGTREVRFLRPPPAPETAPAELRASWEPVP